MTTKKSGKPVRDFNDAGTGESFTKGKAHDFEAGAFENYLAAGLIETPDSEAKGDKPKA